MTSHLRGSHHPAAVGLILILLLSACHGGKPPHPPKVSDTIAAHQGIPQPPDSRHLTADVKRVAVSFESKNETRDFFVETRSDKLRHTPCQGCHESAVENLAPAPARAHWDISLEHASPQTMDCATCHDPAKHGEGLVLLSGAKTTFDLSFQVCGQCHFEQRNDWAGGAHGKRLASWSGERVVRNCTGCHDPHQPKFGKRLPRHAATPTTQDLPATGSHGKEEHHD